MKESEKEYIIDQCNLIRKNTLMETLSMVFTEVGDGYLVAEMPVTSNVHQPDGVLHGGAMVALAESVGSAAAFIFIDREKYNIRGIEISANHVKSVRNGKVIAKAICKHMGRTTQLWQIDIVNEENLLVSSVKLTTLAILKKKF